MKDASKTETIKGPEVVTPAPHEQAAKFTGEPTSIQLPFMRKIAAYVNKDAQPSGDAKQVEAWAAALKAVYGD